MRMKMLHDVLVPFLLGFAEGCRLVTVCVAGIYTWVRERDGNNVFVSFLNRLIMNVIFGMVFEEENGFRVCALIVMATFE